MSHHSRNLSRYVLPFPHMTYEAFQCLASNVVFDLFFISEPIFLLTRARWEPRPEDDGSQAEQKTPRPHLASLFSSWTRFIRL